MPSILTKALFFATSVMAVAAQPGAGTKGKTDGEPGTNVEAHCCGMKGLGGATVEVLCHPEQIALGKDFTVNVRYRSDVPRPVDVHVDVLNAQTKTFYAGKWAEMDDMAGDVSLTIRMADQGQEPFLWKVFVAPRGEPFPNMLAETGFVAHLGNEVKGDCAPIPTKGYTPANYPEVNYLMLKRVPVTLTPGTKVPVEVEYDLVTGEKSSLSVALMKKGPNTQISSNAVDAEPGKNTVVVDLPIPANVEHEPVYIVSTLTPEGKKWEDRLGEDRTYLVKLAGRRMIRS